MRVSTRVVRGLRWALPLLMLALAGVGFTVMPAMAQDTQATDSKRELKIDPQGRTDALTLLFFPDTPRPKQAEPTPLVVGDTPRELTREEMIAQARYPWQIPLWEAAGKLLEDQLEMTGDPWKARLYYFPAENGATLTWIVIPLDEPLPAGKRLVAMLRGEDEEDARLLGSDAFPFIVRETSAGLVAAASRSIMPGRYAMVGGLADEQGGFVPRTGEMKIVARVGNDRLRLSKVILAESIEPLAPDAEAGPFRTGGFEVVPRSNGIIRTGQNVNLFYEVLGAQTDKNGNANLTVSYQLSYLHPSRGWVKQRPQTSVGQTGVVRAWSFPVVPQYPATDYKIDVSVTDKIGGGTVSQSVEFSVKKN